MSEYVCNTVVAFETPTQNDKQKEATSASDRCQRQKGGHGLKTGDSTAGDPGTSLGSVPALEKLTTMPTPSPRAVRKDPGSIEAYCCVPRFLSKCAGQVKALTLLLDTRSP